MLLEGIRHRCEITLPSKRSSMAQFDRGSAAGRIAFVGLIVGQIRVFELFSPHLRPGEGNFWLQSSICVHFTRILTAAGAEGTPLVKGL